MEFIMDHCQLCYSSLIDLFPGGMQTIWNGLPIQEIISKCSKYISKDLIDPNTNWNQSICEECQENTKQLVQLDLKLEQVNVEIKELIERITTKILNERQNYQMLYIQSHTSDSIPQMDVHLLNEQEQFDDSRDNLEVPSTNDSVGGSLSKPVANVNDNLSEKSNVSKKRRKTDKSPKIENEKSNLNDTESSGRVTSSNLQLKSDSGGFSCLKCDKKFTGLNVLKRHDCGSTTFECEICGKSLFSRRSLETHNRSHAGEKPHKCETCGKSFTLPHHLRKHLMVHSDEKPYQCDICKKSFREKRNLDRHKRQHSTDESERKKYKCDICSKSFAMYKSLEFHLVNHTGESKHKCQVCEKFYLSNADLRRHELIHTRKKSFKCSFCFKSYSREDTVRMHELTHTGRKDFQCDECGASYYTSQFLKQHKKLKHADEGEFICDVCGKLYKTQIQLDLHRRYHQKRKSVKKISDPTCFTCVVCDRSYLGENALKMHQKIVHVVTTVSSINCNICGKDFDSRLDYQYHKAVRTTSSSPCLCQICNERFRNRCGVICHFNEKHTESEFPFKCACGRAFLSRKELYHHKQNFCTLTTNDIVGKTHSESKPNSSSSNLRRSGRVKNGNTKKDSEEDSKNFSDGERDLYLENGESESESEQSVEIKIEPDIWIKEEPSDFSD